MDHPLAAPDALVRPWRLAAFVAGSIAAIELLILLAIGGGALLGALTDRLDAAARQQALAPVEKPKTGVAEKVAKRSRARVAAAEPRLPRTRVVVRVLNGNGRTGAAAAAASRIRDRGYKIGFVGNAGRTDFPRDLVMYRPRFAGEGRRFARDLRVKRVGPLDGMRAKDLGRAHVVLILGG